MKLFTKPDEPLRENACDSLATMMLAIHDDPGLSRWFEALGRLPPLERRNEIFRMRRDLHLNATEAPEDVTTGIAFLADDRVFDAAREAFRSL